MVRMALRGSSASKKRLRSSASSRAAAKASSAFARSSSTLSPSWPSSRKTSISLRRSFRRAYRARSFSRRFLSWLSAWDRFWSCQTSGEDRARFMDSRAAVLRSRSKKTPDLFEFMGQSRGPGLEFQKSFAHRSSLGQALPANEGQDKEEPRRCQAGHGHDVAEADIRRQVAARDDTAQEDSLRHDL